MPTRIPKLYYLRLQKVVRRLARSTGTSSQIALGTAIGLFVGMTPTVGLQMVIAAAIATLVKANRIAAILPVWITNPATIIPIYSFNYYVGKFLIHSGPGIDEFKARFKTIVQLAETWSGIPAALKELGHLGWDIQLPLWLGCVTVGMVLAVPGYFLMRRAVDRVRYRLHHRRNARQERITALRDQDAAPATEPDNAAPPANDDDSPR